MTSARKRHQLLFSQNQPSTPEVAMRSILHTSCRACTLLVSANVMLIAVRSEPTKINLSVNEFTMEQELHLYCLKFKIVRVTALGYCKKIFIWFGKKLISPKRTTNLFQMKSISPCHNRLKKRIMRAWDIWSWSWNKDGDGKGGHRNRENNGYNVIFFKGGK